VFDIGRERKSNAEEPLVDKTVTNIEPREPSPLVAIPKPSTGLFAGAGVLVGLTALISSSCCVIPIALAGFGVTGAAFSGLEFLVGIRPYLLGGAALALLAGWWMFFRRRGAVACNVDGTCAKPASSQTTIIFLTLGSVFVGMALVWEPYFEPLLLRMMRG
jgi:mercuric ion transport protein